MSLELRDRLARSRLPGIINSICTRYLFGFPGLLLAVPAAGLFKVVIDERGGHEGADMPAESIPAHGTHMLAMIITSLVTGFISALCASAVFVLLMYRQRPKLQLSSKIAKTTFEDTTVYAFKVINTGRRDAISVIAELFLIQPTVVEGGIGYNIIEIVLVRNKLFHIRPLKKVGDKFGAVFEFITAEDLEAEWGKFQNSYLLFRVTAQDSLSLFSHVFTSEFDSPEKAIVAGRFAKGAKMSISTS